MNNFVKSSEKKEILKELNEQFGITGVPYLLIQSGKEKIRAFSGSLSKEEIIEIGKMANVEGVGIYFLKKEQSGIRLSFEAVQILKEQITKNIIYINDNQLDLWLRGNDLDIKTAPGIYVIAHGEDFLGCGKSNGKTIFNYVPKERRLKK